MRNTARRSAPLFALALLAACASAPKHAAAPPAQSALGEVPPQPLASGQCALVLWAQNAKAMRVAIALNTPAVARVQMNGRLQELARISHTGDALHGQYAEQLYRSGGNTLTISFAAESVRLLSGGAVLPSVVLEYVGADGWSSVIPAAGLIACQT